MPKIAASVVFPVSSPPRRNAVVELDGHGTVLSVSPGSASFTELAGVEYYSGILVPGLVDLMCGDDRGGDWLLGRGVRVAGTVAGARAVRGVAGNNEPVRQGEKWSNLHGARVDYIVYRDIGQFNSCFCAGPRKGTLIHDGKPDPDPAVATFGRMEMLELMLLLQAGPDGISLVRLVEMCTINGSRALGYDRETGSLDPGKAPGLNIIEGIDIAGARLMPSSRLRRIC